MHQLLRRKPTIRHGMKFQRHTPNIQHILQGQAVISLQDQLHDLPQPMIMSLHSPEAPMCLSRRTVQGDTISLGEETDSVIVELLPRVGIQHHCGL